VTDPDNNQQSSSLNSLSVVGLGSLTPSIVSTLDVLVNRRVKFATVYADPPWPYSNTASRAAAENHYRTMTLDAIRNEPVKSVAAENSHLHLWTTNAFLREAFDVMHDWGFKYKSCLIWVKPQLGMGNYWRVSHEYLLFGIRGDLPFGATKFAAGNQHAARSQSKAVLVSRLNRTGQSRTLSGTLWS
jgi:N6-adenosine-specific RNA methylase IME4